MSLKPRLAHTFWHCSKKYAKKSRQMQTRKVIGRKFFDFTISAPSLKGSPSHLTYYKDS
ncbi:MAG: hypothetical protein ACOZBL_05695 [Patescibacteria group bacterium]